MAKDFSNKEIVKTIKLFIGGEFPRTESGRSYPIFFHNSEKELARLCQASRKDFRNSVEVAEKALASWSAKTSFNRGQILYRMAEMAEGKKSEFAKIFVDSLGLSTEEATAKVQKGIDAFIVAAGWADKYSQLLCSVNQINGPFHNFTTPTPIGVSIFIEDDQFNFAHLCQVISSAILTGNTLIVLLGKGCPMVLAPLAEVCATSDLPGGVVNILTGELKELVGFMGGHYEVQSILYGHKDESYWAQIQNLAAENLKRTLRTRADMDGLELIAKNVEMQTVWHPVGI